MKNSNKNGVAANGIHQALVLLFPEKKMIKNSMNAVLPSNLRSDIYPQLKRWYFSLQLFLRFTLCFSVLLISCTEKVPDSYQIVGEGLAIPDQVIFFVDTYSSSILDSSKISDGKFDFKIAKNKIKSGLLSIRYFDNERKKSALVGFPLEDEGKIFHKWFFVEDSITKLGEFKNVNEEGVHTAFYAQVTQDGYENNLVRQYPDLKLSSSNVYDQILADYSSAITKNKNSKFLVGCLFRNRADFSKWDLKRLFALFSNEVKASFYGRILSAFFDADKIPSSFSLANAHLGLVQDIDKLTKLNVLVFRGNDISPFLQEDLYLESLKQVYEKNSLVSISYVSSEKPILNWKATLQYHRPTWPQLMTNKIYVDHLYFKYNFRGLPLIVFTDQFGRVLSRIEGYNRKSINDYINYIDETI